MSRLHDQLSQAANRNRELLQTLNETDYAPPALEQNTSYITDLKNQISKTDRDLARLHAITQIEHQEHINVRDSVMRRFAHRLGGQKGKDKFTAKQEKEEKEFLEAWQKEREAEEQREQLGRALETATTEQPKLQAAKERHSQAQSELDQMYHSIFNGPTPEVPGEDQMEQLVQQNNDWFQRAQMQLGNDKLALESLKKAKEWMERAIADMNESLSASTWDVVGGGVLADVWERNALSKSQVNLMQCHRAMDEARHAQPAIPPLSRVDIDDGHMMGDVLFDNIFSDLAQHDRLKASFEQMRMALGQIQQLLPQQQERFSAARDEMQQAANHLGEARKELQDIRSQAFEQFASGGGFGFVAAPPGYESYGYVQS